jgi:hypothetical protein
MISRRNILVGGAAAAVFGRRATSVLAIASQPVTPVNFEVPAGACASHTHVFGDARRFPSAVGRAYTPEPASIAEMRALHADRFLF